GEPYPRRTRSSIRLSSFMSMAVDILLFIKGLFFVFCVSLCLFFDKSRQKKQKKGWFFTLLLLYMNRFAIFVSICIFLLFCGMIVAIVIGSIAFSRSSTTTVQ